ncbi:heat shock ClpB-like protein [Bacillus phage Shbh1]|uniref:Heat shock ClpB-like protein n=1 Tax=Bacillus phage Shbh1 TaxID=1796992 RepID=A0A142F151_9CAUD|nr:heat shock ClpB-like protein [Bacillus phage Shbh1]AMQ66508.1 heat shock ClpB-like protein [Bacillus phage Shbh1]
MNYNSQSNIETRNLKQMSIADLKDSLAKEKAKLKKAEKEFESVKQNFDEYKEKITKEIEIKENELALFTRNYDLKKIYRALNVLDFKKGLKHVSIETIKMLEEDLGMLVAHGVKNNYSKLENYQLGVSYSCFVFYSYLGTPPITEGSMHCIVGFTKSFRLDIAVARDSGKGEYSIIEKCRDSLYFLSKLANDSGFANKVLPLLNNTEGDE